MRNSLLLLIFLSLAACNSSDSPSSNEGGGEGNQGIAFPLQVDSLTEVAGTAYTCDSDVNATDDDGIINAVASEKYITFWNWNATFKKFDRMFFEIPESGKAIGYAVFTDENRDEAKRQQRFNNWLLSLEVRVTGLFREFEILLQGENDTERIEANPIRFLNCR